MNDIQVAGELASIETLAQPWSDQRAGIDSLRAEVVRLTGESTESAEKRSVQLAELATHYGNHPFTPLESMRERAGLDRASFGDLLGLFEKIPALSTAVQRGPAGKYWTNTIIPLDEVGALDAAVYSTSAFPYSVGLYPGPTCMFRCHFCVRVTGARYAASSLEEGNERFAAIIDEVSPSNPNAIYMSGGLEPLTNPNLGDLVSHAAKRGFNVTVYTNAFALTEQTLARQPELWRLGAVRTSLYGLNDEEYESTTGKAKAFGRVKENLKNFLRLREQRQSPIKLGLNHIILPGRAGRLNALIDFIAELNESSPERPLDFVTVREDYSGRADGRLAESERDQLRQALLEFIEYAETKTPGLNIDLGYALESLRKGVDAELLRIRPETMRPTAHPQVAVQVDLLGDVYLYREAGFPELDGADRYIAGRVTKDTSLQEIVHNFVSGGAKVEPRSGDEYFLDGFDQSVTARLNQLEQDIADGWEDHRGFLRGARSG